MERKDKVRVGLNGFWRIGKLFCRAAIESQKIDIVGINEGYMTLDEMVYQFKYDTSQGVWSGTVSKADNMLVINGNKIKVFSTKDPRTIPWQECGAEYIAECTGLLLTIEACKPLLTGNVKKVVVGAPAKDQMPTLCFGVNHKDYKDDMKIISNASCTTYCLATLAKILHENYGIVEGLMTTVHSLTATQFTVDGPSQKDWRLGRAAAANLIPSTSGAARALAAVLPALKDKLTGISVRAPTINVGMLDLTVRLERPATVSDVAQRVREVAASEGRNLVDVTDDQVVSSDFYHDSRSCVFDPKASLALTPTFLKLVAWYDGEWAYAVRFVDLIHYIASVDGNLH